MGLHVSARRVVCTVLVGIVTIGGVLTVSGGSAVASGPSVGGDDYPWRSMSMDGMSPLRFAYRNCTDYVAYQLNKQLAGSTSDIRFDWSTINASGDGNASAWQRGAQGKFTSDATPAVGAVAWWGESVAGGYGHVALVQSVMDGGDTIRLHEYNTSLDGRYQDQARTLTRGQAGWPEAFLHIADVYTDGTYLSSDSGRVYVVAGGAALPISSWAAVGGEQPAIPVRQGQVDIMPEIPRDGTVVRDYASGASYEIQNGSLKPFGETRSSVMWGRDIGEWAEGYARPAENVWSGKGPLLGGTATVPVGGPDGGTHVAVVLDPASIAALPLFEADSTVQ